MPHLCVPPTGPQAPSALCTAYPQLPPPPCRNCHHHVASSLFTLPRVYRSDAYPTPNKIYNQKQQRKAKAGSLSPNKPTPLPRDGEIGADGCSRVPGLATAQSQRPTNLKGTKRAETLVLLSDRAWGAASTSHLPARTPSSRPRNLGLNHWGRRVHPLARCDFPTPSPLPATGEGQQRAPALLPALQSLGRGPLRVRVQPTVSLRPRPPAFSSPRLTRAHAPHGRPERPGGRGLQALGAGMAAGVRAWPASRERAGVRSAGRAHARGGGAGALGSRQWRDRATPPRAGRARSRRRGAWATPTPPWSPQPPPVATSKQGRERARAGGARLPGGSVCARVSSSFPARKTSAEDGC
ncbi:translation initiation factor IF-2-like [Lutra lutra]|uniref:translation initiation factor IF-2-like n=1 Tax=Lutra lutra TaxID=9657 RepID=UPI001FD453DA|nr:translation initiation factor IF-2-like [Lutra lutra]